MYGMLQNLGEIPLEKILLENNINLKSNINLVVDKTGQKLIVFADTIFVKSYKVAYGRSFHNIKSSVDDYVTPVGNYKICSIDVNENYYKMLKLDFPNRKDAAEALKNNDITRQEFDLIIESRLLNGCPYAGSSLGADIGIQGMGYFNFIFKNLPFTFNWTNGSVSISNESIDELLPYVKVGTKVTIVSSIN